ncbi:TPA: type VI secretion system Vgr family protein [Pseudomonas aeruginosa]|uniref:type VI secretion system Vgr family protein n=3 Tax=Pseudomonas aeruginosa TaxID=287 RepID=UPI000FC43BE4|nr:type VI secretion system tip protein TssI/VgrG [Pseudomonas aeruginosa]MDV2682070.1 type VI secretion system tip protein TssI/VgrG [Pseudomonas aeruginosa]MDV2731204.1 type VI secretion system tip protein TssI/VgrG [Pseudomonas aeruginosa]RUE18298.1 type VI secretion system tip protein VgrG [Pseudomonas aeruginosa]HBO2162650.1 type VI secretion system tip protein VgrG [Pseudomonas aeruginosa]HBO2165968.1 type VI secretion system tip protein VgrG [Pseudomonas aeruginosa]
MAVQSDLRFTFTAGADAFEVVEFSLTEGLSEAFLLDVELSCANPAIDFGQVLDRPALLTIWQGGQPVRYVHGSVTSFQQGNTGFRRTRYRAIVEPRLARLRLASDWRIFQTLAVPDIAKVLLKKHAITLDYEQKVTNAHAPREYCVQAGDTDYHFVERIMREEGFFYGFLHNAEGHRLIHCDRLWIFGKQPGLPVEYNPMAGGDRPGPALRSFTYSENVRTARQTQRDYNFKNPLYNQQTRREGADLDHQASSYERYDYPGRYKSEVGEAFTQDRLRGHRGDARQAIVEGDDARLVPGISFDLIGHPRQDMNRGWRPVLIEHHGKQYTSQAEESADAAQGTHYSSTATLVPDDAEWRAEPMDKPLITGPQQATVVGPPGEEIYCDEFGRVKVQFPWDREGKNDEHSSCWIRVSQNISGALWGHMAIPRIGQEVIVSNFDGDPDQPVITGRSYNANQRPPYELPANKTRMTIKSQTHKGDGFNEIRFEDEADQEEVFIHAQKDQNNIVNNDETTFVGHDRSERVDNDETVSIGHDRKEDVGNDETISIGRHRKEDVGKNETISIGRNRRVTIGGHKTETITKTKAESIGLAKFLTIGAAYQTSVGAAMNTTVGLSQSEQVGINKSVIVGKTYSTTAGEEFSLTVGKSSLVLKADGTVLINGVKFDFSSSEHTQISSKVVDIN